MRRWNILSGCGMVLHDKGDWVSFSDAQRLTARIADFEQQLAAAQQRVRELEANPCEHIINSFNKTVCEERDKLKRECRNLKSELGTLREQSAVWRKHCHPTCPGCGLKPDNEQGKAVLWCDECVSVWREHYETCVVVRKQEIRNGT